MFDLPAVGPYTLANAPLAQALAQVRFPLQARLGTLDGIAVVQEKLSGDYPSLIQEQTQGIELQFSPEGPQASAPTASVSYTFSSDDGFKIIMTPESATLSVNSAYKGVADFTLRFEKLVHVLSDNLRIPRCERLGVKFLSTFSIPPGSVKSWARWFKAELVGWVGSDILKPDTGLATAITQVAVSAQNEGELVGLPTRLEALIRHGLAPGGSLVPGIPPVQLQNDSYVLDLDFFVVTPQTWNAGKLKDQFVIIHGQVDRFFRWTLSAEGEDMVGLEESQ
jgi:uncharacterized protein (TIGR04255 family)